MSIQSWKDEFYPVPAHEVSKEDALQHSIVKWYGLRPAALHKHGLETNWRVLVDMTTGERFLVDSCSCALCVVVDGKCPRCPLARSRDGDQCDNPTPEEMTAGLLDPYHAWTRDSDPEPMIEALHKAKQFVNDGHFTWDE